MFLAENLPWDSSLRTKEDMGETREKEEYGVKGVRCQNKMKMAVSLCFFFKVLACLIILSLSCKLLYYSLKVLVLNGSIPSLNGMSRCDVFGSDVNHTNKSGSILLLLWICFSIKIDTDFFRPGEHSVNCHSQQNGGVKDGEI